MPPPNRSRPAGSYSRTCPDVSTPNRRAVTPPDSPIRFNARFLVVSADRMQGTLGDTVELSDLGFRNVDAILPSGLALVTAEVLRRFLAWRAGTAPPAVFRHKRWLPDG